MILSTRFKFIFLGNRKSGSTSMESILERFSDLDAFDLTLSDDGRQLEMLSGEPLPLGLRQQLGKTIPKHYTGPQARALCSHLGLDWASYRKIVVIRNPWARVLSLYAFFQKKGRVPRTEEFNADAFEHFVLSDRRIGLMRLQTFTGVESGAYTAEGFSILRLENLSQSFAALWNDLGLPGPAPILPMLNVSPHPKYIDCYSSVARAFVEEMFDEDIRVGDYEFDGGRTERETEKKESTVKEVRGRLFLHIGPADSGERYIQLAATLNRASLRASGITYPRLFTGGNRSSHNLLVRAIGSRPMPTSSMGQPVRDAVALDLLTNARTDVFMSAEALSTASGPLVTVIRRNESRGTHVLFTVRDREATLIERWRQLVMTGLVTESFTDWLPDPVASKAHALFNQAEYLRWLQSLPGCRKLALVHFDGAIATDQDPFELVSESFLGVSPEGLILPSVANDPLGPGHVEVLRQLHRHNDARGILDRTQLFRRFVRSVRRRSDAFEPIERVVEVIRESPLIDTMQACQIYEADEANVVAEFASNFLNEPPGPDAERQIAGEVFENSDRTELIRKLYELLAVAD